MTFHLPILFFLLSLAALSYFISITLTIPQLCALTASSLFTVLAVLTTLSIVKKNGILEYGPTGLKNFLMSAQILDWLMDTTFFEQNISPFMPLLVNPNYEEILSILHHLNDSTRQTLLQDGGFGRMLPKSIRSWLHPDLIKDTAPLNLPSTNSNQNQNQDHNQLPFNLPPPRLTSQQIISNQLSQGLQNFIISLSQKSLFRSTAVALGVLFIMLLRSKAARNTSMSVFRVIALVGLGGTATGAALAAYYRSFVAQEKEKKNNETTRSSMTEQRRRLLHVPERGMEAARQVLQDVRFAARR